MESAQTNEEIAAFFDRCAEKKLMLDFPQEERAKLSRFFVLWAIPCGSRVLEPGCGAGRLTAELAKAVGPEGEVCACDLSPKMLQLARARNLPSHVRFECESVLDVQRPDAWFDRVICLNVFPHFAQIERVLGKFARLLKPDGELWINHFEGSAGLNCFHRRAAPEVSDHALPPLCEMERLMTSVRLRVCQLEDCAEHYILKAKPQCASTGTI
jgi:ubiquinone/menaquinone biosynthesis C-methylase UbiE